jgi:hypothetical protein
MKTEETNMADALSALRAAERTANKAVRALEQRMQTAGPDELADLADQHSEALTRRAEANERIENEIVNPSASKIARLETATETLEKRIAEFKAQEASLGQLATALNIMKQALSLILLV